mgnify:CR=1 FL=1
MNKIINEPIDSLPKTFLVGETLNSEEYTFRINKFPTISICNESTCYHMLMHNIHNKYISIHEISELDKQFNLFDEAFDINKYISFEYNSNNNTINNKTITVRLSSDEEIKYIESLRNKNKSDKNTADKNTAGKNTAGKNTAGENTSGKNTAGENTSGKNTADVIIRF